MLPRVEEIRLDPVVVTVALLIGLAALLAIGLLPACWGTGKDVDQALRSAGSRTGAGRAQERLRGTLAAFQVALAVALVVGAGLISRSLRRAMEVRPGFNPVALATLWVDPSVTGATQEPARLIALYRELMGAVGAVPGVKSVTMANHLPGLNGMPTRVLIDGEVQEPGRERTARFLSIPPNYFSVMEIPVLRGRAFRDEDLAAENGGLIVNAAFAAKLWPGQDPIGRRITVFHSAMGRPDFGQPINGQVIGVVGDTPQLDGAELATPDDVYVPYTWNVWGHTTLVVRADRDVAALLPTLEKTVRKLHPELPTRGLGFNGFQRLDEGRTWKEPRVLTALLTVGFGASAVALAVLGLYAVLSYLVGQRAREIAVRAALGASRSDIVREIVGQGMRLALAGTVIGLAAAAYLTRFARGALFGVAPTDPLSFGAAAVLLLGVAFAASLVPARRAGKVEPMVVLRGE